MSLLTFHYGVLLNLVQQRVSFLAAFSNVELQEGVSDGLPGFLVKLNEAISHRLAKLLYQG